MVHQGVVGSRALLSRIDNEKASIVMGDVVVECNLTEDSAVVVMILVESPKFRRSGNIERNPIQVQPSGNFHLMLL